MAAVVAKSQKLSLNFEGDSQSGVKIAIGSVMQTVKRNYLYSCGNTGCRNH